ncbi:trypsin-like serine peptidase [Lentzea sp. NPDC059081]|uniref:trypsin-like serine peptidase n=1 Tax=Lentzea sp. NPDC059081 TaxID=3346719 RepID=UPI0036D163E9
MSWKALSTTGVVIGAVLVAATPAHAAGQVVTQVPETDRAAALAHWTPERMKATGEGDVPPAETISQPYAGPAPAGVGRLFASTSKGQDLSCSATVVPSATKDVALTAGHCVNGGLDRWDNPIKIVNVVFVPGYDHGNAPHGVFAARAFAWSDTYTGPTSGKDDDAVIALDPADGRHVEDAAGAQDISFDEVSSPAATTTLGYPVSQLNRGEALVSCGQPATLKVNSVVSSWQTGCDLAGGSSGGPWLRGFDQATGRGTIFSVTSRGTMNEDLVTTDLTGSAFTDAVRALYDSADRL